MIQIPVSAAKNPVVLLDLSSIKSGGGAQVALNFLHAVNQGRFALRVGQVLISRAFPFPELLKGSYDVIIGPSHPLKRILFEQVELRRQVRQRGVTHVYTLFGPGLPKYPGVRRVVGMAYSNLANPEVPFFAHLPLRARIKKQVESALRFRRLTKADHLIFETAVVEEGARRHGLVRGGASVLAPTPTAFLKASPLPHFGTHGARILFLAGPQHHKNMWRLLGVLKQIDKEGLPVRFHLSMDREAFLGSCPPSAARPDPALLDRYFVFLGRLRQDQLQAAYDACNVVGNLAELESFSNNYMEAWLTGRPILASDRAYARHICGGSALYVEPHDPASLLAGLRHLALGEVGAEAMVRAGQEALAGFPTMDERLAVLAGIIAPGTRPATAEPDRGDVADGRLLA